MSVYGKKIVIDGVEYVAVPEISPCSCAGCALADKSGRATCNSSSTPNDKLFMGAFGQPHCSNQFRMILKKVEKKKVEPKAFWTGEPGKNATHLFIKGKPYINPFEMLSDKTPIEIDGKDYKIIHFGGEMRTGGPNRQTITFEEIQPNVSSGAVSLAELDSKIAELNKPFIAPKQKKGRYIVCLIENGALKPSESPKIHKTEESATKEASRLCKKHNQMFVVLKVCAEAAPEVSARTRKV